MQSQIGVSHNKLSPTVALFIGSLRTHSNSSRIAAALTEIAAARLVFEPLAIDGLGFFSQDLETQPPAAWLAMRHQIAAVDAVLFITPEYNRSVPGALKNSLDIASRPYGQSVLERKPAAVISSSVSRNGGAAANQHLRQSLAFLNMPTLSEPNMCLGAVHNWFDAHGALVDANGRKLLDTFVDAFARWICEHRR